MADCYMNKKTALEARSTKFEKDFPFIISTTLNMRLPVGPGISYPDG